MGSVKCTHVDSNGSDTHPSDWFCADGEQREINEKEKEIDR